MYILLFPWYRSRNAFFISLFFIGMFCNGTQVSLDAKIMVDIQQTTYIIYICAQGNLQKYVIVHLRGSYFYTRSFHVWTCFLSKFDVKFVQVNISRYNDIHLNPGRTKQQLIECYFSIIFFIFTRPTFLITFIIN